MSRPMHELVTQEYVAAYRLGVLIRTPLENITHFQAEDKYVIVHTKTNGDFVIGITLWWICSVLQKQATRVHRNCLVMNHALPGARLYRPAGAHTMILESSDFTILVSRNEAKNARKAWEAASSHA